MYSVIHFKDSLVGVVTQDIVNGLLKLLEIMGNKGKSSDF